MSQADGMGAASEGKSPRTSKQYNDARIAQASKKLAAELSDVRMASMGEVLVTYSLSSPSAIYAAVKDGTHTEPIKLSARCARWPVTELRTIAAARSAGMSSAELKTLVADLHAARKTKLAMLLAAAQ